MGNNVVLKTENLRKEFGSLIAVNDLSLEVHEGEIFGFLGPNGAGKSTSINMMCGLLKPTSGSLYMKGQKVIGGDKSIRTKVGVCPQHLVLWTKLTCNEQLIHIAEMYGVKSRIARERANKLLKDMGLEEKKNKLAGTLSGGMQRRMNIILALMNDPEILVLDEPEAGLDPQSRILVRDYIKSLAKNKTVILTTHNMDEAERVCNHVAIIDKGKLLELDTIENLKKKNRDENILEIEFENNDFTVKAQKDLAKFEIKIKVVNNHLLISDKTIFEKLPEILKTLKDDSLKVCEIKLRENSLEDIFINLTGRRLRE
jgi:ABC-2 type transport system ATP-binding protein